MLPWWFEKYLVWRTTRPTGDEESKLLSTKFTKLLLYASEESDRTVPAVIGKGRRGEGLPP